MLLAETLARAGLTNEARAAAMSRETAHGPDAGTHLLLAALATSAGDTDEALRRAASAAGLLPHDARPHAERGRAFLRLRRWTDAEAAWREALRLDPLDALIRIGLARSLVRQNRTDEALHHALEAVSLRHDLPVAHFQMGAILSKSGDYPRAIMAFEAALALQPGLRPAHRYLARLYGMTGRVPEGGLHHLMAQVP
jgi:tetratricopeptide (TPR) repeat protein